MSAVIKAVIVQVYVYTVLTVRNLMLQCHVIWSSKYTVIIKYCLFYCSRFSSCYVILYYNIWV